MTELNISSDYFKDKSNFFYVIFHVIRLLCILLYIYVFPISIQAVSDLYTLIGSMCYLCIYFNTVESLHSILSLTIRGLDVEMAEPYTWGRFLLSLSSFNVVKTLSFIESVLTFCLISSYLGLSAQNKKRFSKISSLPSQKSTTECFCRKHRYCYPVLTILSTLNSSLSIQDRDRVSLGPQQMGTKALLSHMQSVQSICTNLLFLYMSHFTFTFLCSSVLLLCILYFLLSRGVRLPLQNKFPSVRQ